MCVTLWRTCGQGALPSLWRRAFRSWFSIFGRRRVVMGTVDTYEALGIKVGAQGEGRLARIAMGKGFLFLEATGEAGMVKACGFWGGRVHPRRLSESYVYVCFSWHISLGVWPRGPCIEGRWGEEIGASRKISKQGCRVPWSKPSKMATTGVVSGALPPLLRVNHAGKEPRSTAGVAAATKEALGKNASIFLSVFFALGNSGKLLPL